MVTIGLFLHPLEGRNGRLRPSAWNIKVLSKRFWRQKTIRSEVVPNWLLRFSSSARTITSHPSTTSVCSVPAGIHLTLTIGSPHSARSVRITSTLSWTTSDYIPRIDRYRSGKEGFLASWSGSGNTCSAAGFRSALLTLKDGNWLPLALVGEKTVILSPSVGRLLTQSPSIRMIGRRLIVQSFDLRPPPSLPPGGRRQRLIDADHLLIALRIVCQYPCRSRCNCAIRSVSPA